MKKLKEELVQKEEETANFNYILFSAGLLLSLPVITFVLLFCLKLI